MIRGRIHHLVHQPVRETRPAQRVRVALRHAARPRRRLRDLLVAPGPVAVGLAVFVVAAYFISRWSSANTDTHLFLTVSIADRGSLNIDPFAAYTTDIASAHGHFYADKAPGLSLAAVPVYLLIKYTLLRGQPFAVGQIPMIGMDLWVRYLLALAFAAVPTGLIAALLYALLRRLGLSRGWCATLALTYGLGTIARPFASLFFSHQFAALLGFAAFFLLFRLRRGELDERYALVAGMLAGYALISELPTGIIAVGLGLYAITVPGIGRRLGAWYAAGMVPPLALFAAYNRLAFGSFTGMGYDHLAGPQVFRQGQAQGFFGVTYPHLDAIWGTTFSPYRGLFFLSPVLLLAIPGCVALARRVGWRPEALLCAAVGLGYLLFNVSYFEWDGGSSIGPRQILPCLPFLVLPIGALLVPGVSGAARRWRTAAAVLAGYSIVMIELCAATTELFSQAFISPLTQFVLPRLAGLSVSETHPWQVQAQLGPALAHGAPLFLGAKLAYNWGQLPDWPGLAQLVPLGLLVALILLWATLQAQLVPVVMPRVRAVLGARLRTVPGTTGTSSR